MKTIMDIAKTYKVKRITEPLKNWRKDASFAVIDCFPWSVMGAVDYQPKTFACAAADSNRLFIYMETDEKELRMEKKGFGFVHTDSCMEFFLSPDFKNPQYYLNWEFNPAGAMYLSFGTGRENRETAARENYKELFSVQTGVFDAGWNLEFSIPLSFLRCFCPSADFSQDSIMRGNFYKCGDNTACPHYGCWSPISLPKPDFHCPNFFGTIQF